MKIKTEWKDSDIKFGLMVWKYCEDLNNPGYIITTLHIIGYIPADSDRRYSFVSLSDGNTLLYSRAKLLSVLNEENYTPAPQTAVLAAMKYKIQPK